MEFSRQEYWSGLSFTSPGDLPEPGIEPRSPALQADSLPSELLGKVLWSLWDVAKLPTVSGGQTQVFLTADHRTLKSFSDNLLYFLLFLFTYVYYTSISLAGKRIERRVFSKPNNKVYYRCQLCFTDKLLNSTMRFYVFMVCQAKQG